MPKGKSRSKIVEQALRAAQEQGFTVEIGKGNRAVVASKEGRRLVVTQNPGQNTTVENELSRLRKFGVKVPPRKTPKSPLRAQLQHARHDFLRSQDEVRRAFEKSNEYPPSVRRRFRRRYDELVLQPVRGEVLPGRHTSLQSRVSQYRRGTAVHRRFLKRLKRRGPLGLMAAGIGLGLDYLMGGSREDSSGGRQ